MPATLRPDCDTGPDGYPGLGSACGLGGGHRSPAVSATPVAGAATASMALSGGSTAPAMIEALLRPPCRGRRSPCGRSTSGWRPTATPIATPGSSAGLPCTVRLMPVTAADLRAAAARYARSLPERFDVVHLGIGDDGHTASWPPGDPTWCRADDRSSSVPAFNGRPRMTLTHVGRERRPGAARAGHGRRQATRSSNDGCSATARSRSRRCGRASTVVFLDFERGTLRVGSAT